VIGSFIRLSVVDENGKPVYRMCEVNDDDNSDYNDNNSDYNDDDSDYDDDDSDYDDDTIELLMRQVYLSKKQFVLHLHYFQLF
jgi:NACalpha-BTF3-like transcription factor